MPILLSIWSQDTNVLRRLLRMTGQAFLTRRLHERDDRFLYDIIVKLKLDDLRRNCKDGIRNVLLILKQIYQEDYQKVRQDIIQYKDHNENLKLPEEGPASEEQINEIERKALLYGPPYTALTSMLRARCSCLRNIQEALHSIG